MMAADLVAGNTRLRARLADIVTDERAATWAGRPLPEVAEALRAVGVTAQAGGHLASVPSEVLVAELLAAVDARRDARLRAVAAAYQGDARAVVKALFEEEDRADLITLLRAAATGAPTATVPAAMHAVGRFTETIVRDLVGGEPGAIVARLIEARLPDPQTAAAVARAWDQFALHTDLDELESTVAVAHADATRQRVAGLGSIAVPVAAHLASRRDAVNLVTAVRLRGLAINNPVFLPEGTVSHSRLRAVAAGREVAAVAPVPWRTASAAAEPRGPDALRRALDGLVDSTARHPSWRTEPLGARVPLVYTAMVRHEATELRRLVVFAAEHGKAAA